MLSQIWLALWFFLPGAVANATPVFLTKWFGKKFDEPLDFHKTWRGKPIFGDHKTWRGLIGGIVMATLTLWLQIWLDQKFGWAHNLFGRIGYHHINPLILGPLFAIGALGGDAVESFVKRRIGKKAGDRWLGFDQIDYVIGGSLTTLPLVSLPWPTYIYIIVLWSLISWLSSWFSYKIHLKDVPH
ncbi:MAG: CDP-archaeol synthase [Candidatus Nomurabacteria bacterium]|jgi:CDP-2,3-bis-(O-geranylgeranyl)-sn-glycerol synthase|nr:CDP-archaeol synthase [Candidatus Nomurabacteria bacterium]